MAGPGFIPDLVLIRQTQLGDFEAFKILISRYRLYATTRAKHCYFLNHEENSLNVDEIFSIYFGAIFKCLNTLDDSTISNFYLYWKTTADHEYLNFCRENGFEYATSRLNSQLTDEIAYLSYIKKMPHLTKHVRWGFSGESFYEEEVEDYLSMKLKQTNNERYIIVSKRLEGFAIKEIALEMNLKESKVRYQIRNFIAEMKDYLAKNK